MNYFADSSKARVQITRAQEKAISNMYRSLADDISKEIDKLRQKTNVSSRIRSEYLRDLSRQVNEELRRIGENQSSSIRNAMLNVSQAVFDNNAKMLSGFGVNIAGISSRIPTEVVKEIASGGLYKGRWSLNSAIWRNTVKNQEKINMIVARGVAGQKSMLDIAKDIEKYVKPSKAIPSRTIVTPKYTVDENGKKVIRLDKNGKPLVSRYYFGRVDYNAQRLARTMVSHAYQDTLLRTTRDNPFVECYEWLTSNSDRVCEICKERAENFHGVIIDGVQMNGYYYADDVPLDHPNGMCTLDVYIPYSYDEIASRIADWASGDADPDLDDFAESLGFSPATFKSKVR